MYKLVKSADTNSTNKWKTIASNFDGTKLVAAEYNGYIYTSTNSGINWSNNNNSSGSRTWIAVASSSDGTKLVAAESYGYIYTSTNSGIDWSNNNNSSSARNWRSLASSFDGTKLIATPYSSYIFTSNNSGITWFNVFNAAGSRNWISAASSSDGNILVAAVYTGKIYTSADSGVTWITGDSPSTNWLSVASSSNGNTLVAADNYAGGNIYTSTNFGANWVPRYNLASWVSVALSYDGKKIFAVEETGDRTSNGGYIHISTNSGIDNWTQLTYNGMGKWKGIAINYDGSNLVAIQNNNYGIYYKENFANNSYKLIQSFNTNSINNWKTIASNDDGTKLVAAQSSGYIYTSTNSGITWSNNNNSSGSRIWSALASSSDGTKLVAAENLITGGPNYSGYIYTSTNSGIDWSTNNNSSDNKGWTTVVSSSNGFKLVATPYIGKIYTSIDSGTTWLISNSISTYWVALATSSDGTKLVAAEYTGYIYTSTDSGMNWNRTTLVSSLGYWTSLASNSDGTKLVAAQFSSYIYTSTDSGITWNNTNYEYSIAKWRSLASSSDGTILAATQDEGFIYISNDSGNNWNALTSSAGINLTSAGLSFFNGVALNYEGTKLVAIQNDGYGIYYTDNAFLNNKYIAQDICYNNIYTLNNSNIDAHLTIPSNNYLIIPKNLNNVTIQPNIFFKNYGIIINYSNMTISPNAAFRNENGGIVLNEFGCTINNNSSSLLNKNAGKFINRGSYNNRLSTSTFKNTSTGIFKIKNGGVFDNSGILIISSGSVMNNYYNYLRVNSTGKFFNSGQYINDIIYNNGALPQPAIQFIAAGPSHSLAINSYGNLYGWGDNTYQQFNNNLFFTQSTIPKIIKTGKTWTNVAAGEKGSYGLTTESINNLYGWGNGNNVLNTVVYSLTTLNQATTKFLLSSTGDTVLFISSGNLFICKSLNSSNRVILPSFTRSEGINPQADMILLEDVSSTVILLLYKNVLHRILINNNNPSQYTFLTINGLTFDNLANSSNNGNITVALTNDSIPNLYIYDILNGGFLYNKMSGCSYIQISPDGKYIAATPFSSPFLIKILNVDNFKINQTTTTFSDVSLLSQRFYSSYKFSSDSSLLVGINNNILYYSPVPFTSFTAISNQYLSLTTSTMATISSINLFQLSANGETLVMKNSDYLYCIKTKSGSNFSQINSTVNTFQDFKLTSDGNYVIGRFNNQLYVGNISTIINSTTQQFNPILSTLTNPNFTNFIISGDGKTLIANDNNNNLYISYSPFTSIAKLVIPYNFVSYKLSDDGKTFVGQASNGILYYSVVTGDTLTPLDTTGKTWISVKSGLNHALALDNTNKIYSWGDNTYGQLGNNVDLSRNTVPTLIPAFNNTNTKILEISCGDNHSLAIDASYNLWIWGFNTTFQFGINADTNSIANIPIMTGDPASGTKWLKVAGGTTNSLGLKSDGSLYQLNNNTAITPIFQSDMIGQSLYVVSSFISNDGVYGYFLINYSTLLKYDLASFTTISYILPITSVFSKFPNQSSSDGVSNAILINTNGRDGFTDFFIVSLASMSVVKESSVGNVCKASFYYNGYFYLVNSLYTYIIKSDGSQDLTFITNNPVLTNLKFAFMSPTIARAYVVINNGQINIINLSTPLQPVNISSINAPTSVATGATVTCAFISRKGTYVYTIFTDGSVIKTNVVTTTAAVTRCSLTLNNNLPILTSFITLDDNYVYLCGVFSKIYIIQLNPTNNAAPVLVTTFSIYNTNNSNISSSFISPDGNFGYFGGDANIIKLQLSNSFSTSFNKITAPSVSSWSEIATGGPVSMALSNTMQLYAWGKNTYGQFGTESTPLTLTTTIPQLVSNTATFSNFYLGNSHALGIENDYNLYAWGINTPYGQLGTEDTIDHFSPYKVTGNINPII